MQKGLKILVPTSILFFLVWTIIQKWTLVFNQIASANFILLLASLVVLASTYVGGAYFWYKILQAISFQTSFKEVFRVFIVSNFGRFIPGVVLHYVVRVYLSKGLGLGVKEGLSTVFLEAYYNLAGAIIVSLLALPIAAKFFPPLWLFSVAAVVLSVVVFIQPVKVFALLPRLPYLGKYLPEVIYKNGFRGHLSLLGLSVGFFLLYGVAFFLLISAFVDNPLSRILDISGLLSASWVVGFLTPVAPGGLGVSDFSLASFLALAFRFNLFLAECLMFLLVIKLFGFDVVSSFKRSK